jgi:hypothetical protein
MEQGGGADDLQTECTGDLTAGFNHLKLRQSAFEFIRRQAHGEPESPECGAIIHGRAPNAERLRVHTLILAKKARRRRKIYILPGLCNSCRSQS